MGNFRRWGVQRMGVQERENLREEEFRRWRVVDFSREMWSSADGTFRR